MHLIDDSNKSRINPVLPQIVVPHPSTLQYNVLIFIIFLVQHLDLINK